MKTSVIHRTAHKLFSIAPCAQNTMQIFVNVKNENKIAIWINLRLFFVYK